MSLRQLRLLWRPRGYGEGREGRQGQEEILIRCSVLVRIRAGQFQIVFLRSKVHADRIETMPRIINYKYVVLNFCFGGVLFVLYTQIYLFRNESAESLKSRRLLATRP